MTDQQQPDLTQQLAAALPAHTCIEADTTHPDRRHRYWTARWTTPAGMWKVTIADELTIRGPGVRARFDDRADATVADVIAILRTLGALGALDPPPADRDAAALIGEAWNIIANASDGDWNAQPDHWREAAQRWREQYHQWLDHRDHTGRPVDSAGSRASDPGASE